MVTISFILVVGFLIQFKILIGIMIELCFIDSRFNIRTVGFDFHLISYFTKRVVIYQIT